MHIINTQQKHKEIIGEDKTQLKIVKWNEIKMSSDKQYEYKCAIEINFPSAKDAMNALEVLQVDDEIGDRVIKTLSTQDTKLIV